MGSIINNLWVNTLTKVDETFLGKWNKTFTAYAGDIHGREEQIPAKMVGIDEEMNPVLYSNWRIIPMDVVIDMRRYNDEENISSVKSKSGYSYVEKTQPDQPHLATYIINGYSQDFRVFREMREFAVRIFPVNAFITVDGTNLYVETVGVTSDIDYEDKNFALQLTYNVWINLSVGITEEVKTVYNNIKIGFTNAKGRFDLEDADEEEIIIS